MKTKNIVKLLNDGLPEFPPGLKPMLGYRRLQDDHDGTFKGHITVMIGPDGDIHLDFEPGEHGGGIRFRNFFGGGKSLRVHTALTILALAIKLDNEERPIQYSPPHESD